ncbi:MAG: hypothetical protein H6861_00615 [Rhodospirillales bacterium]|nr:hypothetical protein [Rhodospirillales bacterium]
MAQGAFTPAFANLSAAFRLAFPSQHWNDFSSFGVHSDVMLSLAAGVHSLGFFTKGSTPQPQVQFAQDCGTMSMVFQHATSSPFNGLGNQLPFDTLMILSNHIHEWNPPDTSLDRGVLYMCEQRIRETRESMTPLLQKGSLEQRRVILNLGNVAMLAGHLIQLSEDGVAARPEFRTAFSHMPVLDSLPQWVNFRAESLGRSQPPPAEGQTQISGRSEVYLAL